MTAADGWPAAISSLGYAWLPFAAAGLGLLLLAIVARFRSRSRPTASLAEFLLVRGLALTLLASMIALLADAAAEGDGVTGVDRPLWSWMVDHRSAGLTAVMTVITEVGSTVAMGVIALVVALLLLRRQASRDQGLLVAAVASGAGLLVLIAKPLVGRARPPAEFRLVTETNQSFPSGHALASVAILGVLVAVLVRRISRTGWRVATIAAAALIVLLIGASRLYLGVHWATDVAGGWLIGMGWLLTCLTAHRLWTSAPAIRRQLAPGHSD